MLNLREYQKTPARLADWLPWAGLVAPGVVLNKDGSFQRTLSYRGPDLESSSEAELLAITARVNNALRRLGSGWMLHIEADRQAAEGYPTSQFPDALSWLVDEERRASFGAADRHFESRYYLTLTYLPPEESRTRAAGLLYANRSRSGVDWTRQLQNFTRDSERFHDLLQGAMPESAWLDDGQTLTYLHQTVSTQRQALKVPDVPFYLDALLADRPLATGLELTLGDQHLRVVSVRGFPASSWPGVLDSLNHLGIAYRWSTRFICLDKQDALAELTRLRRQWSPNAKAS